MQSQSIQLSDVIYNAASQCFEALVTIRNGELTRRYPCATAGPITMSFSDAAAALKEEALRQHKRQDGLSSQIATPKPSPRALRLQPDQTRKERIVTQPNKRKAA